MYWDSWSCPGLVHNFGTCHPSVSSRMKIFQTVLSLSCLVCFNFTQFCLGLILIWMCSFQKTNCKYSIIFFIRIRVSSRSRKKIHRDARSCLSLPWNFKSHLGLVSYIKKLDGLVSYKKLAFTISWSRPCSEFWSVSFSSLGLFPKIGLIPPCKVGHLD